jgi:hypothetical protein
MSSTFIGYCSLHDRSYQEREGCPLCRVEDKLRLAREQREAIFERINTDCALLDELFAGTGVFRDVFHDQQERANAWVALIVKEALRASGKPALEDSEQCMVRVAALAIAAIENIAQGDGGEAA